MLIAHWVTGAAHFSHRSMRGSNVNYSTKMQHYGAIVYDVASVPCGLALTCNKTAQAHTRKEKDGRRLLVKSKIYVDL